MKHIKLARASAIGALLIAGLAVCTVAPESEATRTAATSSTSAPALVQGGIAITPVADVHPATQVEKDPQGKREVVDHGRVANATWFVFSTAVIVAIVRGGVGLMNQWDLRRRPRG
ncbi:MAG: hypothetical protein QM705_11180 [Ancrocorticia sp.]